jgi:hypothetical protein
MRSLRTIRCSEFLALGEPVRFLAKVKLRSADVLSDVWRFVSTKHPIPEEMDHCEIAVGVPMMNEV